MQVGREGPGLLRWLPPLAPDTRRWALVKVRVRVRVRVRIRVGVGVGVRVRASYPGVRHTRVGPNPMVSAKVLVRAKVLVSAEASCTVRCWVLIGYS